MDWYYSNNGQQAGPVSGEELGELFRRGAVGPADLVWNETMSGWEPIGQRPEFAGIAASASPAHPAAPQPAPAPVLTAAAPPSHAAPSGPLDTLSIVSFVLGLLTPLCCGCLAGIPAIICGHIALARLSRNPGFQGRGFAIAGLILGYLGTLFTILYFVFFGGMAAFEEMARQIEAAGSAGR